MITWLALPAAIETQQHFVADFEIRNTLTDGIDYSHSMMKELINRYRNNNL